MTLHRERLVRRNRYFVLRQTLAFGNVKQLHESQHADLFAVVELQDGRVTVLDNKTSSMKYTEDSVANSEQLALYMSILNIQAEDPNHSWNIRIDCCAYAVLSKKLTKVTTKVCKSCEHSATSGHDSCNALIGKKRCGGEWTRTHKFSVPTQFLVDNVPEKLQNEVLDNAETVIYNIQNKHFPQNFDSCMTMFGPCEYRKLCFDGSLEGLIDIKGKAKNVEKK